MYWLEPAPRYREGDPDVSAEDLARARARGLSIEEIPGPGPQLEASQLLRRLYGDPADCEPPRPHVAGYRRLRAEPCCAATLEQDAPGRVEFRHWPSLGLGYIEDVRVNDESRRQGLGARLLSFAVEHLRARGSRRVFAFTTSPEGLSLCVGLGFSPEAPEEDGRPWRRWAVLE